MFHLSCVQILWDNLRGTELSEKDGGESETTEASQKRCDHDYHDRSKRWTHRWQQDPTSAGTGCGIPGGTGMWSLTSAQTHAHKPLLSSVTKLNVIWNTFEDSYAALYCCLSQIQKMGLQPSDISMFSTLMDLVKEARELAEQNQWKCDS